ncbi:PC3-like endoprotease variant B [Uloborus diversus]|uniref:PC3-like endoprotease variant B n=1 Tax=Uloborus diversus TaxID=327109 RepID=UPI002409611C|nr:PC3-like endoprotease variant B [Uloborus diversus]
MVHIQWASQQTLFHRVQRSEVFGHSISGSLSTPVPRALLIKEPSNASNGLKFNDPLFKEQWYLDEAASEEFLYLNSEFKAIPENSHGTYCAAIAAGVANNRVCGVGVAYDAKIVGVRILNGPLTDAQEAIALVHALEVVDIYTASWGPEDKGNAIGGPGHLARKAILKGVTQGRRGKGAIYVWAAGNGGAYLDNCNLDGYASSPFTVTVGALGPEGRSAFYSEHCAAVLASVYVGGPHYPPSKEDLEKERQKPKVVVPEGRGKCRQTFQGTSAAAPLAAGAIALLLQANPSLGWRDVQHIILNTCRIPSPEEHGWLWNAAGFHFHPKIGCGALDVDRMVESAIHWKPVGRLKTWKSAPVKSKKLLLARRNTFLVTNVNKSSMHPINKINRLETVVATVDITNLHCGHLEMSLTSPMGTRSAILTRRPYDNKTTRFPHWDFTSLHFWGEDPEGKWLFEVSNHGYENGFLNYFSVTFYGTEEKEHQPQPRKH